MNTAERRAERRRANIARKATIAQLKAEWEAVDWAYEPPPPPPPPPQIRTLPGVSVQANRGTY